MKIITDFLPLFLRSRHELNLRPTTLTNYGVWSRWLVGHWGTRTPGSITAKEIVTLSVDKSRTATQLTQCFFRWLMAEGHLSRAFDVGTLPPIPRSDERQVSYLRPVAAHEFLGAVRPEYRAAFVLALYAGLRPYECCRIEWRSIHLADRRIKIEARVSKIRRARMIEGVPAVLWWWLRRCPGPHQGRVLPARSDSRAAFAWIVERRRAAHAADIVLAHDVLRHTFATYFVARSGNLGATAKILGHYKLQTLIAHYDGVTTRAEAREYFRSPQV